MTKPYIDLSLNERMENEYSIHGLCKAELEIILESLDWAAVSTALPGKKKITLELAANLNESNNGL